MKFQMKLKRFAFDERSESMKAPVGLLSDRTVLHSKMKRLRLFKFFKQETVLSVAAVLAVLSMFFVPPDADYLGYIDLRTLAILFSLMTIMAGLRRQGVFDRMGRALLARTDSTLQLVLVLAVDLPSGINTDTGEVAEGAVRADLTVTFDSCKPLHTAASSAPLCGKIVCADIGIRDEWHPVF